jgi:hypothetical protein
MSNLRTAHKWLLENSDDYVQANREFSRSHNHLVVSQDEQSTNTDTQGNQTTIRISMVLKDSLPSRCSRSKIEVDKRRAT